MIRSLTIALTLASAAGSAFAQPGPRALVTNQAGFPQTTIPGTGGIQVSSFTQAQIGLSPSGNYWTMAVNASGQPTTSDTFLLAGTAAGVQRFVPEGVNLPGVGFGITGRPNNQVSVNDSGVMAFKVTTNAPGTSNEMVLRFNLDGNYDIIARESLPIPNVAGETYSVTHDSTTILNDGRVLWRSGGTLGPTPSTQDDWLFLSGSPQTTYFQTGLTIPTGQAGDAVDLLIQLNDEAYINSAATRYLVDATVGTTRAIVIDNEIKFQNGLPIIGLNGELPTSIPVDEARMFSAGDWAAWGVSASGTAFAVINDALYVREGDAIPGGLPGETLTGVYEVTMNDLGDIAYAARTSSSRDVIVVDKVADAPYLAVKGAIIGQPAVAATQIDYDADGTLDNVIFGTHYDDTLGLSSSGNLYFAGRMFSSAGGVFGDGLFVLDTNAVGVSCEYDYNQDENVDLTDAQLMAQVAAGIITADPSWLSGDLNGDENADLTDAQILAAYVATGLCGA